MKKSLVAGAVLAAALLGVSAANATTVNFAYDLAGNPVATGSFSYATGMTGVLGFGDLTAFTVNMGGGGGTYTLADVGPLTDYVWFAYDTAANMFDTNTNACGFSGCGFQESLGALNSSGTFGFFFNPAPGAALDYNGGSIFTFDTIVLNSAAVPEPATWAMTLLGVGLIGAGLRSRRKVGTALTPA
jgi:PEP-CTERM motif